MREDVEIWYKYRPTPKEFLDKLKLLAFIVTSFITMRNWKKRYNKPYHVEFVIPSLNVAYSAIGAKDVNGKVGVRYISLNDLEKSHYGVITAKSVDISNALKVFKEREGLKYDKVGIFLTQVFNMNRHNPNKDFCSKLVSAMLGTTSPHQHGVMDVLDYVKDRNKTIEEQREIFKIEKKELEDELERLRKDNATIFQR